MEKNPLLDPLSGPSLERVVSFASGIVLLVFLLFISDRGFDITDEGFYFLTANHPEDVKAYPGFFYVYMALLPKLGFETIQSTRILAISVMAIAGACFGYTLATAYSWAQADQVVRMDPWISAAVGLSGALAYYMLTVMGPNYNYMVSTLALVCISVMFIGLASTSRTARHLLIGLMGICVGMLLFVKITSGVCFFLLSVVLLSIWPRNTAEKIRLIAIFLTGVVMWIAVHFSAFLSPVESYSRWMTGYEALIIGNTGHGARALVSYSRDSYTFSSFLTMHYGVVIVCIVLARALAQSLPKTALAFNVIACAWIVWEILSEDIWFTESAYVSKVIAHYACWIVVALVAWLPVRLSEYRGPRLKEWLVFGTLLSAPVLAVFGTGTRIAVIISTSLAPWMLVLFILANRLSPTASKIPAIVGAALCMLLASQVISSFAQGPYRLNTGILGQTEPVHLRRGGIIKVDEATARFWRDIHDIAERCALPPRADVLGFFSVPGVVYALGAQSPGAPWFLHGYSGSKAFAEFVLTRADQPRLKQAWILQGHHAEGESMKDLMPDLAKFSIDFPSGFESCGSAYWPVTETVLTLWKPR